MATEFGLRLREARKGAKLTQEDLSKRTGISQSTISTAERSGASSTDTATYAAACGVSALWLATGEGEKTPPFNYLPADIEWINQHIGEDEHETAVRFASSDSGKALMLLTEKRARRQPIDLENNPDYPAIRRVKFKLSAGATGFAVDYTDEEGAPIVFQKTWYSRNGLTPERLFAVGVCNGSMEPGLHHGDTVVVNTASTDPKDGIVFAVNYEGEMVIKRLVRDAGQWWLSSDNSDQSRYPRKVCDASCILIGEIVHKQSMRI